MEVSSTSEEKSSRSVKRMSLSLPGNGYGNTFEDEREKNRTKWMYVHISLYFSELKQLIQNILQELLLSISCHDCNQKKGTLTAEEFIEQTLTPQKLRQIPKTKQLLKYMAYMNATRWVLYNTIKGTYDSVRLTYGSITKRNRINAGIPKAHHIDAKCITGFSTVPSFDVTVVKTKMRRHNRQLHRATFSKGHVRRAATLPKLVHSFQLLVHTNAYLTNHYVNDK